ncbi:hypothetical protein DSL72_005709 [Monilinia vaccinii-corymbosi]|uniref:Uncharacterized protein n=1 Tax=Monilinia vaccinii-corymbosi TaxID=61207 RepID=A0A8A3PGI2_9HELO|nr:hypothetical protein DSL72_005709 [Monilinia vaccinii-corymbosi]
MSTKPIRDSLAPHHERRDPLLRPPNFPPSPTGRDHLSPKERKWEEALDELGKQIDYEDIHGPGTSQHEGARWKYVPANSPDTELELQAIENPGNRDLLLDASQKRVMQDVQRDLDYTARAREFIDSASDSLTSEEEEEGPTDFSPFVDITRKEDAKESQKKIGKSKGAEYDAKRFDTAAIAASRRKKEARREAKAKRREEGQEKLFQEVIDEYLSRLEISDEEKEEPDNLSTPEAEERDPPEEKSRMVSDLGKEEESMEEEQRKYLSKRWTKERITDLRKRAQNLKALEAQRQIREPDEYTMKKRAEMNWRAEYDQAFYRNTAAMRKGLQEAPSEDAKEDEKIGAGAGAAGGRRFIHNEAESPQSSTEELREQSKSTPPFIYDTHRLKTPQDSTSVPEGAVQNYPFPSSNAGVNDPSFQNDVDVMWTWKRTAIFIVTGVLLGALGVQVKKSRFDE